MPICTGYLVITLYTKIDSAHKEGGVAIYVKDNLTYQLRDDLALFSEGEFESIFIEITSGKKPTFVGEIYRIPDITQETAIKHYESIISKLHPKNKNVILGTDQNFDYLNADLHRPASLLLDTFINNGLAPCITTH